MIDISNIIEESEISEYADPISIDCLEIILEQIKKCICNIKIGKKATGFFCYIPHDNKKIPVLMTNNHVINKEKINEYSNLMVTLGYKKENKHIKIDENRKIYTSEKYDTTIIEIKEEDKINDYLELDEDIFEEGEEQNLTNKNIYIIQYPSMDKGSQIASLSSGKIKKIQDYFICHLCGTKPGSSGSPILKVENNKLIGIHIGGYPKKKMTKNSKKFRKRKKLILILEYI